MRRAERKLQLSHNVVGDDVTDKELNETAGVETGDLRSIIFGLHMFDPKDINDEESGGLKLSELHAMADKVTTMRHQRMLNNADRKCEVNSVDLSDSIDHATGDSSASVVFDSSLDEVSYRSWVEKFNKESQSSGNSVVELGNRKNTSEDKHMKLDAAQKKREEKKLARWEAHGYYSLSVREPIYPVNDDMMSDSGSVHFVYGDCTCPSDVCPSEPTIIFR